MLWPMACHWPPGPAQQPSPVALGKPRTRADVRPGPRLSCRGPAGRRRLADLGLAVSNSFIYSDVPSSSQFPLSFHIHAVHIVRSSTFPFLSTCGCPVSLVRSMASPGHSNHPPLTVDHPATVSGIFGWPLALSMCGQPASRKRTSASSGRSPDPRFHLLFLTL